MLIPLISLAAYSSLVYSIYSALRPHNHTKDISNSLYLEDKIRYHNTLANYYNNLYDKYKNSTKKSC